MIKKKSKFIDTSNLASTNGKSLIISIDKIEAIHFNENEKTISIHLLHNTCVISFDEILYLTKFKEKITNILMEY